MMPLVYVQPSGVSRRALDSGGDRRGQREMASEGPERRVGGAAPAIAMLANGGNTGQFVRPRTGVAFWRTALAIDIATATGLMVAWQGVLWLFALLVAYAGRAGTAPETSDEFFTRILVKAEGARHL